MLVQEALPTPASIKEQLVLNDASRVQVQRSRRSIEDILLRKDPRLLMVVGPCSIHNTDEGLEYASRLKVLAERVADEMVIVFRTYMEKPRTTVGWKGLINDPHLDESFDISSGLTTARQFLFEMVGMGLPIATEALDPMITRYIHDLVSWSAIGARTNESQTHREMASGLKSPIGVKNSTDGDVYSALNAMAAIAAAHRFLGIDDHGKASVLHTKGNPYVHMVLRGGRTGTNYDAHALHQCSILMEQNNLPRNIMVDCAHANSNKDHHRQSQCFSHCTRGKSPKATPQ